MKYLGESLALVTAIGWVGSSVMYEKASRKMTGLPINIMKITFTLLVLSIITLNTRGMALPFDAPPKTRIFLFISGIIGLFIGDYFLFKAYTTIGARVTLLLTTLTPIIVSVFGFLFLKEILTMLQFFAILVTCVGIMLVVLYPKKKEMNTEKNITIKFPVKGLIYGIIAVLMDAFGIIFTKAGSSGYDSFATTQTRAIPALIAFILYITYRKEWKNVKECINDKSILFYTFMGTIMATMGMCALVEAMKYAKIGIVSTLASTSPIMIIPFSIIFFKEKVSKREVIGAIVSFTGVALLFL